MVDKSGSKTTEPRRYFSTLYYKNQTSRQNLPTMEEQQELENLLTGYESERYQIPDGIDTTVDPRNEVKRIEEEYERHAKNKSDMRWLREYCLETEGNDYNYRFWLQYQVEQISAGNRSMRLLKNRSKEFNNAMLKLSHLTLEVAENLYTMSYDVVNSEVTNNIHPLAYLIELNNRVRSDIIILNNVKELHFQYERDCDNNIVKQYVEEKPLFYHLSNTMLQIYFKSIRKSTKLKFFKNKDELLATLANLDVIAANDETFDELLNRLRNELLLAHNQSVANNFYRSKYVCETNSFFRKLHNKIGKVLEKWARYYGMVPQKNKLDFFPTLVEMSWADNTERLDYKNLENAKKKFRSLSIKTATSCLFSAFSANLINFDAASIDELDSLYDSDYEHSGTSYPNVIRMSKKLYENLNRGDHAIIRHFQMDEKRNMYCLPRTHTPFGIGERGNGGFLHNESMSVSLHPALLNLVDEGRLNHTRFEPTQETLNALNILQETQWSINLDFLDFIADFTLEGKKVSPYPINIRQGAWQRSDNMELKEIFVDKMKLRSQDVATKSRVRTINANLKQARKNLFNSGNIFWHPWFCDWRGRFNTKVNELSPQGDDLSKAMLLFAEWKPLGEVGRYWLYVRGYDLLRKVITPELPKIDQFSEQVNWVEKHIEEIVDLGNKLNRHTPNDELSYLLDYLQVKKPGPKAESFQRIAFLIEFARIQNQYNRVKDWEQVYSGLPVHLDASCNGFQHIAALTRNEKLAMSVNLLNNPNGKKGDLYQEVADEAKNSLLNNSEESDDVRSLLSTICETEELQQILIDGIFTRDFCKPLVMITGYGARDLASQIMNLNGKKRRGGRFKPSKDKKSIPTLHHESLLYQVIESLHEEHGGFEKLILSKDKDGYMTPADNCILGREFGLALGNYIRYCIGVVTDFKFEEVKQKLANVYYKIDTVGIHNPAEVSQLYGLKSEELRIILSDNDLPSRRLDKQERLEAVKQLVVEKWKNKLYFSWQASDQSSTVRYIKWKLDHNRSQATLPTSILPKNYVDPGDQAIEQFISNSPSLGDSLRARFHEQRIKTYQTVSTGTQSRQSQSVRKLKNLVMVCLRNIALSSTDEKEKQLAKHHLLARFIELKGGRTHDGKKNSHRFSLDTGNDMKFNTNSKAAFKNSIGKLFELSNEILLGMVPNFIHSFDALHMQNVVLELDKYNINDIWAVHDSFGVHPRDIEMLRNIVKETFIQLHEQPLESHIARIIELNLPILDHELLPPEKGERAVLPSQDWINDVRKADYLIS